MTPNKIRKKTKRGRTSNLKVGLPRERRKRNNKQENEFGDKNNLETGVK